ncbi:MAG: haloalkane dehalogenase [Acidimicrobiia bacterium]|nr:haloalkane dehalogenase [Acidimicrobiia bacterium]MDH5503517.1 haloalkane dehalogenase [Acidimicrobiia bacterium]
MYTKSFQPIFGKQMAYIDAGEGDPIVFLHGNPTSSFLWRFVMAELEGHGRLLAPDLIGMGDSDKVEESGPDAYTFAEHRRYLDALLDSLDLGDRIVLVVHDWGSALGFDWANRHRERVRAIAYMEAIVQPIARWEDWPESARHFFQGLRSEAGESMILDRNLFVERVLPGSVLRQLTETEMNEYRRPYVAGGEARRPTLTWPRQIPIGGVPADVHEIVQSYAGWLSTAAIPKYFFNADPGSILIGAQREFCRSWPNQLEMTVEGLHFIQEDSGSEIGRELARWLATL